MDTLLSTFKDKIKQDILMSGITRVELGGKAKYFFTAHTKSELQEIIRECRREDVEFFLIGDGSNLLISDDGIHTLVIKDEAKGITQRGNIVTVLSGTTLQELVDFTLENSLAGAQRLTGIPGTVGGAVYGNAGAYGQTIADYIQEVVCFDGQVETRKTKRECKFEYRDSDFKKNSLTILEIKFNFPKGNPQTLREDSAETLEKRLKKFLPGLKCPGSFFKNVFEEDLPPEALKMLPPRKDTYGKVPAYIFLEELGAKGDRIGNIQIADFHANLFLNLGGGSTSDFYQLVLKWYKRVKEKYNIELEPEVQLVNLPPLKSQV